MAKKFLLAIVLMLIFKIIYGNIQDAKERESTSLSDQQFAETFGPKDDPLGQKNDLLTDTENIDTEVIEESEALGSVEETVEIVEETEKEVEVDSAQVSIVEIYAEHDVQIDGLTDGRIPLVVKVKISNTGTGTQDWTTNPAAFTISTGDGKTFEYSGGTKLNNYGEYEAELPMLHIMPGQSAEGWVGFEPEWSTSYVLNYHDNGEYIQIPFELPEGQMKTSVVPPEPIVQEIIKQ
ncbi:hypothetical protein AWH48_11485 [Domibacillus aminovorans]|uniref:DUF4352 domain-containing protein n=1 Tax=Domibacillus aminovorans TaxID=29332 RepID=A0A177KLW2_9BACI|nr:DUF4352 domain-containing protein [Domibacillus aminovorans]OAH53885.1 hypothetical protein AWH48_11485 [Domibacillus aminovorans]